MALWIQEADPLELRPSSTEDDLQAVIRAVYKQVLGNIHVMDSQRLVSAESQLRHGDISVRGFVEAIAKSELYRSLFFENSSVYRFIELNCKHFLGRAPQDHSEIAEHVQILNSQGYGAEIDSYLDSQEYQVNFGEDRVPDYRGGSSMVGAKNIGFNRTFSLMRGYATSDTNQSAKLISDVAGNLPTKIKLPKRSSGAVSNTGKRFVISTTTQTAIAALNRVSKKDYCVDYSEMSEQIRSLVQSGVKILSVTEIA